MKAITQDLFHGYQFLAGLSYNPAKDKALFVKSSIDAAANSYKQYLWLYAAGKLRQLTSGGKEGGGWWEDDDHVLFIADREGTTDDMSTTFYRIDVNGGEAVKAFELPLKVNDIRVLADCYLVAATTDIAYSEYYQMSAVQKEKVRAKQAAQADYQVMDEYPYFFNGRGYINGLRNNLFMVDRKTLRIRRIGMATLDVESFDVSGCHNYVVLTGIDYSRFKGKCAQVYLYDIRHNTLKCIYPLADMYIGRAFFYNHQIMVAGTYGRDYGAMEAFKFYQLAAEKMELILDNEGGLYNSVSTDCHYGRLKNFLNENETPYFISTSHSASQLLQFSAAGFKPLVTREGSCDDFAIGTDHILVIGLYDQKLQELYEVKNGTFKQISHFNVAILKNRYVAKPEKLILEKAPYAIEGWVLRPKDFDASQKYPAILDIHGGPKAAYGEVFFHEMQYWASCGYFVFYCNPRGGDGRGNDFADLRLKFGTIDYADIMDYTDKVLTAYPAIDPKRIAVTGGSYGGYMTNWIITHTDRFVCAASQRSISNWITEAAASDYGIDFVVEQQLTDDAERRDRELWRMSPLKYAMQAKTPTLFIHSYEDYRCPIWEAMQLYTVLKTQGIPSRIVGFKGENHELSRSGKPLHRSRRLAEITAWIDTYTKERGK